MSDRMTAAEVIGAKHSNGCADWGRITRPEMISKLRAYGEHLKRQADEILNATDDEILVTTYVGVHVMKNKEVVND